jgi:hypothetical protein
LEARLTSLLCKKKKFAKSKEAKTGSNRLNVLRKDIAPKVPNCELLIYSKEYQNKKGGITRFANGTQYECLKNYSV